MRLTVKQFSSARQKFIFIFALLIFPVISGISFWIFWRTYINQILNPEWQLIGDPLYVMSIFFGASSFIGGVAGIFCILNLYLCIRKGSIFKLSEKISYSSFHKGLLILAILGGGFAFVSNIILLHVIIPEHGYVLCPKKIGYKKNLMRDYVLDVSQCERF